MFCHQTHTEHILKLTHRISHVFLALSYHDLLWWNDTTRTKDWRNGVSSTHECCRCSLAQCRS